jgi:hypothetical protein
MQIKISYKTFGATYHCNLKNSTCIGAVAAYKFADGVAVTAAAAVAVARSPDFLGGA